jgi:hypothetical protein
MNIYKNDITTKIEINSKLDYDSIFLVSKAINCLNLKMIDIEFIIMNNIDLLINNVDGIFISSIYNIRTKLFGIDVQVDKTIPKNNIIIVGKYENIIIEYLTEKESIILDILN